MRNIRVVGLVGPMGCGKSTAANMLVDGYGYTRVRMAGIIKAMIATLGLNADEIDGHLKEVPCDLLGGQTPRWVMQSLGTEWGRKCIDEQIWVRATEAKVIGMLASERKVVIDDIRFDNEVAMIQRLGGSLYRVERAGTGGNATHVSEQGWRTFPVDGVICNDFELVDLKLQIEQIFNPCDHKVWQ